MASTFGNSKDVWTIAVFGVEEGQRLPTLVVLVPVRSCSKESVGSCPCLSNMAVMVPVHARLWVYTYFILSCCSVLFRSILSGRRPSRRELSRCDSPDASYPDVDSFDAVHLDVGCSDMCVWFNRTSSHDEHVQLGQCTINYGISARCFLHMPPRQVATHNIMCTRLPRVNRHHVLSC